MLTLDHSPYFNNGYYADTIFRIIYFADPIYIYKAKSVNSNHGYYADHFIIYISFTFFIVQVSEFLFCYSCYSLFRSGHIGLPASSNKLLIVKNSSDIE